VEGGLQEYAFSKEMRTQKDPGVEERVESVEGGLQEYAFSKEMRTQKDPGVEERVESVEGGPQEYAFSKEMRTQKGPGVVARVESVEGGLQEYAFSKEMRTQRGPGVEEGVESVGGRPSRVRIFHLRKKCARREALERRGSEMKGDPWNEGRKREWWWFAKWKCLEIIAAIATPYVVPRSARAAVKVIAVFQFL
jgi:hypothetical protein